MNPDSHLTEQLYTLVWSAADAIMQFHHQHVRVTTKEDDSPLTAADLASHRILTEGLVRLTRDIPVISEESEKVPAAQRHDWRQHWLIDPLDGTREFLAGNDEFTINLALIEDHAPIFGIVAVPAQARMFVGFPLHKTCFILHRDHTRQDVACRPIAPALTGERPVVAVASRSHRNPQTRAWLEAFASRVPELVVKGIGSALKLCILAAGLADVYPRLGPTAEWDIAAAHAVLLAAGGNIMMLDGAPLCYNTRETLLNPTFIATADGSARWRKLLLDCTDSQAPPTGDAGRG